MRLPPKPYTLTYPPPPKSQNCGAVWPVPPPPLLPPPPPFQVTVLWCKECGRYLQPPKHWVMAELESKELLTFCIKKVRGLNKVNPKPNP